MTWHHLDFNAQLASKDYHVNLEGKVISMAIFVEEETEELKFFTKQKLTEIGTDGILKLLNSPIPASSQYDK